MGYTHYWYRNPEIPKEKFHAIRVDFEKLVLALHDAGVTLAGPMGNGLPELDDEQIAFNGPEACGHPKNTEVVIPWPSRGAGGVGSNQTAMDGEWFAGATLQHRVCNGDCSYESFIFDRVFRPEEWERPDKEGGKYFAFCKTAFRPYDVAVTAFLLIAKHHLGSDIVVNTDGDEYGWQDAQMLCYLHLDYPLNEITITEGNVALARNVGAEYTATAAQ